MPFLKPEMVNKLLIEKNQDTKTIHKDDLDLNKLEKSVSKQQFVEKADVFVTVDGVLKAVVKQNHL
jgi:cell division protein FtsQ